MFVRIEIPRLTLEFQPAIQAQFIVRIKIPFLGKEKFDELRAIPGVSVRSSSCEFPPDCAPFVARVLDLAIEPEWPATRKLALDPESLPWWPTFKSWQKEGAPWLARDAGRLLWTPAGSGKTPILLTAATLRGAKKVLAVTRTLGIRSFVRDAKWSSFYSVGIVRGRGPDFLVESVYENFDVMCLNYEILSARLPALGQLRFDALIFDEAHCLRSHKYKGYAQWTQSAEMLSKSLVSAGGTPWLATATPVIDRRRDILRQLDIAYPDGRWGSGWTFAHRYLGAYTNAYGGLETKGKSNTEELHHRLKCYSYRKTKAEVSKELPKLRREKITIEFTANTRRKIPRSIEGQIAEAAALKLEPGVELAADVLRGPGKVVIVTSRRAEVTRIEAALKKVTKGISNLAGWATSGELEAVQRVKLCQEFFEAPDPAYLIATMDSIGESVDLQDADAMIVLSLPYKPGSVEQLEGRVSRTGGTRPVTIYYLIAPGTIDDVISDSLISKLADTDDLDVAADAAGAAGALRGVADEAEILASLRSYVQSTNFVPGIEDDDND